MANLINRSPSGLVDALCERVDNLLSGSFWMKSEFQKPDVKPEDIEYHTPHVHAQFMPVSLTSDADRDKSKDYPVVLIACTDGTVNNFDPTALSTTLKVMLYFGVWDNTPDNQGWRSAVAMAWRVMQDLMSSKICNGYVLDVPIKLEQLLDKEPPYFSAVLETFWKGAPPAIEVPNEQI